MIHEEVLRILPLVPDTPNSVVWVLNKLLHQNLSQSSHNPASPTLLNFIMNTSNLFEEHWRLTSRSKTMLMWNKSYLHLKPSSRSSLKRWSMLHTQNRLKLETKMCTVKKAISEVLRQKPAGHIPPVSCVHPTGQWKFWDLPDPKSKTSFILQPLLCSVFIVLWSSHWQLTAVLHTHLRNKTLPHCTPLFLSLGKNKHKNIVLSCQFDVVQKHTFPLKIVNVHYFHDLCSSSFRLSIFIL